MGLLNFRCAPRCPAKPTPSYHCAVHLVAGSTTSLVFPQIARTKTCTTPRKQLCEAIFLQKHVETCTRLHMHIFTMSLNTIGSSSQRGFWCIQEVIEKCSHAKVCLFQHVFAKRIASYRCLRGVVQVLVRAVWGKTRLVVDPATRCTALSARALLGFQRHWLAPRPTYDSSLVT